MKNFDQNPALKNWQQIHDQLNDEIMKNMVLNEQTDKQFFLILQLVKVKFLIQLMRLNL